MYAARAQCSDKCTYNLRHMSTVYLSVHWLCSMNFYSAPVRALTVYTESSWSIGQCTYNVHCMWSEYTARAKSFCEYTYNIHWSCTVHWWCITHVYCEPFSALTVYSVGAQCTCECTVYWKSALQVHSKVVSALTVFTARALCTRECTYSVHCRCMVRYTMFVNSILRTTYTVQGTNSTKHTAPDYFCVQSSSDVNGAPSAPLRTFLLHRTCIVHWTVYVW